MDESALAAAVASCKDLIDSRFPDDGDHGAAAMLLGDGTILTGTAPDAVNASVEVCHEIEPYCGAYRLNQRVVASVCLHRQLGGRTVVLSRLGIAYVEADATAPGLLEEQVFDAVACNFGLSDTDHLYGALANVARLLRPSGRFVFCILHPCFPGAARVSASWPSGGIYHGEAWWLSADELSSIRNKVGATHRTVSSYLNAFVDSGLVIDRVAGLPAERDRATERPGAAGAPAHLVVRPLRSQSPSV